MDSTLKNANLPARGWVSAQRLPLRIHFSVFAFVMTIPNFLTNPETTSEGEPTPAQDLLCRPEGQNPTQETEEFGIWTGKLRTWKDMKKAFETMMREKIAEKEAIHLHSDREVSDLRPCSTEDRTLVKDCLNGEGGEDRLLVKDIEEAEEEKLSRQNR